MSKDLTPAQKVATHVEMSAIAIEKGRNLERAALDQQQKIASHIPAAIDALLKGNVITPAEKAAAERVLADPVASIQLLTRVAAGAHQKTASVAALGQPTGPTRKSAADKSQSAAWQKFQSTILG